MNAIYQDFGFVGDKKRLNKVVRKLIDDFFEMYTDEYTKTPTEIQLECPINGFCRLIITWTGEEEEEEEEEEMFNTTIFINSIPTGTNPDWFELCRVKNILHQGIDDKHIDSIVENLSKELSKFDLRAVKVCSHCHNYPATASSHFCKQCEPKVVHYDEVCPICIDREDTDSIWVETPCRHIFHSICLQTYICNYLGDNPPKDIVVPCPTCRGKKSNYKVL